MQLRDDQMLIVSCVGQKRSPVLNKFLPVTLGIATALFSIFFSYKTFVGDTLQFSPEPNSVYAHALKLQAFTNQHPGRYAMGGRAGLTANIINKPVLQLEGLIADQRLVDSIKKHADLDAVLRSYGIHYLIESANAPELDPDSIEEPHSAQAGAAFPKMFARKR